MILNAHQDTWKKVCIGSSQIRSMKSVSLLILGLTLWHQLGLPFSLKAHPISLSTVVANVETNRVKVEMKILVEDLMLFQEIQPDQNQVLTTDVLQTASNQHHQFLLDYFQIRTLDGKAIPGKVTSTDTKEIPETGVNIDAVMSTSIYYELEFTLDSPPDFLTFSQNFGGDSNPLPSVMDLIVLQNSARLGYPVQISPKNPHSTELDWENPPTNDRKSWRQRRELMKQRREDLLGITSYSTTYSYIYITDSEVRHEILVPLLTLETWFPIDRQDTNFLEVEEQDKASAEVEKFFQSHASVLIDGIQVPANVDRVDFYGLDFRDFAQRSTKKRVGIHNARAGIILSYATKQAPQTLKVTWETFNQHTPLLNSVVYDHNDAGFRQFFTPAEPSFEWTNQTESDSPIVSATLPSPRIQPAIKLSLVSLSGLLIAIISLLTALRKRRRAFLAVAVIAGTAAGALWPFNLGVVSIPRTIPKEQIISTEEADQVFAALHGNIYRAFDYRQESQVYDVLAESVTGDLLESLYLKIKEGLRMEEQGGAIARVNSSVINQKTLQDRLFSHGQPQFHYQCTWNVSGTVEHWGHIHTRENQYEALFTVSAAEDAWKITDLDVASETRISFQTGLRETK